MTNKVNYIPEGYHTVTPYLIISGATAALEFYKQAFGAIEVMRFVDPKGKIGHAEILIGNSHVMLADETSEVECRSPQSLGGSPISLMVYVENVDAIVTQAVTAGAELIKPVEDQFYGDRTGGVKDPFGHTWYVATHKEDVSEEEIKKRMAATMHC